MLSAFLRLSAVIGAKLPSPRAEFALNSSVYHSTNQSPKLPRCMSKILSPTMFVLIAAIIQSASGQILKLTPLSTFGTNGNGGFYPNERDYLDNSGQLQRGMAWNPVTGHLLLVCRTNAASPTDFRV